MNAFRTLAAVLACVGSCQLLAVAGAERVVSAVAKPCRPANDAAARAQPDNVYFGAGEYMDVESRAIRALSFLHDAGAFQACVPGAKPCAVVDIGAGQESPRKVIKRMGLNVKYLPVDYKARSEETIVCNLNNIEFPHAQLENYNVVAFLALGSLEYVIHRWALVASLAMYPNAVTIIHYQFGKGRSAKDFAWVSPLLPEHFSVLVAPFNGAFYPDALAELHVSKNLPSYGAIVFNNTIARLHPTLFNRGHAYIVCRESCNGTDVPCSVCNAQEMLETEAVVDTNHAKTVIEAFINDCRDRCSTENAHCLECLSQRVCDRPDSSEAPAPASATLYFAILVAGFVLMIGVRLARSFGSHSK